MSARSIASCTISFGLVAIPIKIYVAASPESVSFNLLHNKCGGRVKQQYICPTDANEVVSRDDMVKGYRLLSQAMDSTNKVAVGRWTARGKDQLVLIRPYRGGLILHQLYYSNEV